MCGNARVFPRHGGIIMRSWGGGIITWKCEGPDVTHRDYNVVLMRGFCEKMEGL